MDETTLSWNIAKVMFDNGEKSVLVRDYGDFFYEAYKTPINELKTYNQRLLDKVSKSKTITYYDPYGGKLVAELPEEQKWTSIDGYGNRDLVPGEIATHINNLNGTIVFGGTFLSSIPFAIKYGVVDDLMKLEVINGMVNSFECDNQEFVKDFNRYLEASRSSRTVEEFGIGTNIGIKGLYGRNAGFEERHPGLHLGLGGAAANSHHMDLIFLKGSLYFDKTLIIENGEAVY